MKDNFWKSLRWITILSLICTLFFGSEIPWENLKTICFSWALTKMILYDVSVSVFSSMILGR